MMQLTKKMQSNAKYWLACFFALAVMLTASKAWALQCGPFDAATSKGSCINGVTGPTYWDQIDLSWKWNCTGGGATLNCVQTACGNGVRDWVSGEECDGADYMTGFDQCSHWPGKNGKGTVKCFPPGDPQACRVDISGCEDEDTCGDGKIGTWEACDWSGGKAMLNGKTCATEHPGATGVLDCYPKGDPKECQLNDDGCEWCGNYKLEKGEQCDGESDPAQLNNADCVSLGFAGGTLGCYSDKYPNYKCVYDTSACTGGTPSCGNGRIDAGEDCDGLNYNQKSCVALGCQGGNLSCNPPGSVDEKGNSNECKFNKTSCTGPCLDYTSSCGNLVSSSWVDGKPFAKPCMGCGMANGQFYSEAPDFGLCSEFGRADLTNDPKPVAEYNAYGQLTGWTWQCNQEKCRAYASAKCNPSLSSSSFCNPEPYKNALFPLYSSFNSAKDKFKGDAKLCAVGVPSGKTSDGKLFNSVCSAGSGGKGGWNSLYNTAWSCVVSQEGGAKIDAASCSAGWGDAGTCSSLSGKTTNSKATKCSDDPFWQLAAADSSKLCGADSVVVEKKFTQEGGYIYFRWQCQWQQDLSTYSGDVATRNGAVTNCYQSISCSANKTDGVCGSDAYKKFPNHPSPTKPGSELCILGFSANLNYDYDKDIWTWTCKGIGGGRDTQCSVEPIVACGKAGGKAWVTKSEVMENEPCARGVLANNAVGSDDSGWFWTCEDPDDKGVYVNCGATRCGQAGGRSHDDSFDKNVTNQDFLCIGGGTPDPSQPKLEEDNWFPAPYKKWSWTCTYQTKPLITTANCNASRNDCGWGPKDDEALTPNQFALYSTWGGYMCTPYSLRRNLVTDDPDAWTWECVSSMPGTSEVQKCSIKKYGCGDYDSKMILEAELGKTQTDSTLEYHLCRNGATVKNFAYVYDNGQKVTATWDCNGAGSRSNEKVASCSADVAGCGSAASLTEPLTVDTTSAYLNKMRTDNEGYDDEGYLCKQWTKVPNGSSLNNTRVEWICKDDLNNWQSCYAPALMCEPNNLAGNMGEVYAAYFWRNPANGGLKLCNYGYDNDQYLATPLPYFKTTRNNIAGNYYNSSTERWSWSCMDARGGVISGCQAKLKH